MNILPKKSWHVRNKDNVARVRRDEAQAEDERQQRQARALLAEQEARTKFLRKKARLLALPEPDSSSELALCGEQPHHVDLFRDLEDGKGSKAGNKEYEEEKLKEKEHQEKAIGLLTYLGQSSAEAQTNPPWYQEAPDCSKEAADMVRDEKLKGKLDPLIEMEKYLRKKKGEQKKHKKEKERHKEKDRRKEERKGVGTSGPTSLEELRQERLQREKAERAKAEALLAGMRGGSVSCREEVEMDDRRRCYNSQFNPQLARKPRDQEEQR
ncbi:leukocyte receptor cluster member 1 [Alligator mississippiensis]|uniref:Leukocyte receptor cluster member 1 n=1 Tax=Alligator mississippiensis TaxID=8496 RepID=A0A151M4Q9_ALLMI|nr:leukocyte receptor cluster member 1 [Alligator mississippiensis]KYO19515.1 leukocyte receptor cluster member 1 [Alligator mississippiensis]